MSNFLNVKREQFHIQQVKENVLCCTFYPKNRFLPKELEIIVKNSNMFYDLVETVKSFESVNWWTLNYLASVVEKYNGNYLT